MACSVFRLAPRSRVALSRDDPTATTLAGRTKSETYADIDKMLAKFLAKYPLDVTGRMATLNSFLYANFPRMNFVGFYVVTTPGEKLAVGPYQGEVLACGHIDFGKGVCGTAAASGVTQIVRDVAAIENYIACDDVSAL
jgi:L-methionine (R)-S-oxide reductase